MPFDLKWYGYCLRIEVLVRGWVILDRPPNDPFLRKKEPFTSSLSLSSLEAGVTLEAGASRLAMGMRGNGCHKSTQPHKKLDTFSAKQLHSCLRNMPAWY